MKKALLILALVGLIAPTLALAQMDAPDSCIIRSDPSDMIPQCSSIGQCAQVGQECDYEDEHAGVTGAMCCLFSTINYIVNWLFMVIMILVVILILIGAFTLITASGSEEGVAKGRNYIVFALIGVAVALLARALPYLIRSIMGVTG